MRSHLEQATHATVCQIEEEVLLISSSNWRKKIIKNAWNYLQFKNV